MGNGTQDPSAADRFTRADELLVEQNELLQSLLKQHGVADQRRNDRSTPFENSTFPREGRRLGLPAGKTTFDFTRGRIIHEDIGVLSDDLRSFEEMSELIEGASIQRLRSLWIYTDGPADLEFDEGRGGKFTLEPSIYYPMHSKGYTSFSIKHDLPFAAMGVASTRSQPYVDSDGVKVHYNRKGTLSAGTYDSWTDVPVYPFELETTLEDTNEVASDWANSDINISPYSNNIARVKNTSGNGNAIDARVLVADTHEKDWYDINVQSTTIADDDHSTLDLATHHAFLKVQIQNSTNGNSVSAKVTAGGGSQ